MYLERLTPRAAHVSSTLVKMSLPMVCRTQRQQSGANKNQPRRRGRYCGGSRRCREEKTRHMARKYWHLSLDCEEIDEQQPGDTRTSPMMGPIVSNTSEPASLSRSSMRPRLEGSNTFAPSRVMRSRTPSRGFDDSSDRREGFRRAVGRCACAAVEQRQVAPTSANVAVSIFFLFF